MFLWELKGEVADPLNVFEIPNNQFNDATSLSWWGNRFVVTGGSKIEGMLIDVRTGLGRRQLVGRSTTGTGSGATAGCGTRPGRGGSTRRRCTWRTARTRTS